MITTVAFRVVQALIRSSVNVQLFLVGRLKLGQANGNADAYLLAAVREDSRPDTLGNIVDVFPGLIRCVIFKENREFLATGSVEDEVGVDAPELITNQGGRVSQHVVTRQMAIGVVDVLEVVDIEQHQCQRLVGDLTVVEGRAEVIFKGKVVLYVGEVIVVRGIGQLCQGGRAAHQRIHVNVHDGEQEETENELPHHDGRGEAKALADHAPEDCGEEQRGDSVFNVVEPHVVPSTANELHHVEVGDEDHREDPGESQSQRLVDDHEQQDSESQLPELNFQHQKVTDKDNREDLKIGEGPAIGGVVDGELHANVEHDHIDETDVGADLVLIGVFATGFKPPNNPVGEVPV